MKRDIFFRVTETALEEAYNRVDAIIEKHEVDDVYVTITNSKDYDALRIARKQLEQTRWIPVSERLPNRDEYIKNNGLFNVSDGNRSYSEWFDIYDKQMFGEPTMSGFRADKCVQAWMPLPEPYKAESEEV